MANPNPIKDRYLLLAELGQALDVLERTTGIKGQIAAVEPKETKGYQPDALLDFQIDEKKHRFVVEVKNRVDRVATLGQIKAQLDRFDEPGLLFAPYITTKIARECRQLNIAFLDTAGNAYIHAPNFHIYITGERPEGLQIATKGTQGAGTATALRVVFALLCRPDLLNAPYREIVETANVALGAIGWVFFDLEKRGYIAGKQKNQNRRFLEPIRLFEEWVTNYPIKLRPKLNPRRFRAENPEWWKHADLTGQQTYWGGEVAAQRLTNYLKPATYTLYIKPQQKQDAPNALAKLVIANRLHADPRGDIEILDAFWEFPPDANQPDVVPPILAYADLIATLDPRNHEVAKLIRDKYINDPFPKA